MAEPKRCGPRPNAYELFEHGDSVIAIVDLTLKNGDVVIPKGTRGKVRWVLSHKIIDVTWEGGQTVDCVPEEIAKVEK